MHYGCLRHMAGHSAQTRTRSAGSTSSEARLGAENERLGRREAQVISAEALFELRARIAAVVQPQAEHCDSHESAAAPAAM